MISLSSGLQIAKFSLYPQSTFYLLDRKRGSLLSAVFL
jgi:hypothetical protein